MTRRHLLLGFVLAGFSLGTAQAASVVDRLQAHGFGDDKGQRSVVMPKTQTQPTYMLTLSCVIDERLRAISRVTPFKTHHDDGQDYGLISGHGLPLAEISVGVQHSRNHQKDKGDAAGQCYVQDFSGHKIPINGFTLADDYKAGTRSDWAVIRFNRIPTEGLMRYDLPDIEWQALAHKTVPVRFAAARGLRNHDQSCAVLPMRYQVLKGLQFDGVMPHDCYAIAGQSGSPLSLAGQDETLLVGIHLGRTWMLRSPVTGRPEHQGFARVIDAAMIADIDAIVKAMP